jgi:ABC-type sugar transport system permease subunit
MEIKLPRMVAAKEVQYSEPSRFIIWYRHHRDAVVAWSFLTPMVVYFVIMTFVPMAFLVVMSFTRWNLVSAPTWIGLKNMQVIFSNYQNWFYLKVIGRTVAYGIAILALNVVVGFFIALLLNQNIRFKGLFRTAWYLPSVFSGAVIALLLKIYLQGSSAGVLNMVIGVVGLGPVDWTHSDFYMPIVTVLFSVWQGIGFTVIFFLAGLQGVDENLYDAAKIDGANDVQLLTNITIPQMLPVLLFISVTGVIGSMQMWEIPRLVTGGGPSDVTYTLMWSIQNDAFSSLQVGLGTAESLVLFVLLMAFIGWQLNEYRKQYNV